MKTLLRNLGAPLVPIILGGALALGGLAGCQNAPQVGNVAPEIVGDTWVEAVGPTSAPETDGKWLLVQFFSPT